MSHGRQLGEGSETWDEVLRCEVETEQEGWWAVVGNGGAGRDAGEGGDSSRLEKSDRGLLE